ncbi:MAG: hypothetical protein SPF03_08170 [Faecalimonas umbilicata]|uniref:hypothetical protein n=1 Tax=Faecalimonas umbilicata TaxID=1912855 RepID=UPI00242D70AB|nr:hypothetical protein [Faecalimonas umbilicata]MCI5987141.1 hypothetical protein [Faecalimonas umbilicata]MDY5093472.1 hypothetical protein [Faecalimonas umbilicata]
MTLVNAQKQAQCNHVRESLRHILLGIQKEKYEEIKTAADHAGESVNGYIKKAIDERMERDSE